MLGLGVYVGEADKADEFAMKRSTWDAKRSTLVGARVGLLIDVGHIKVGRKEACPCSCGKAFVDHPGLFYSVQGCDTLFLRDNSLPATRYREWSIADPARCTVLESVEVLRNMSR